MDWQQVLALIGSNFALIFTLWIWSRSESRNDQRHFESNANTIVNAIRQDMKDFHGRLERQDAEFKAGMLLLEEKIRSRG